VQEVLSRLVDGYRGYVMTDGYAEYRARGAQPGVGRLGCYTQARRKFVEAQKVQPKEVRRHRAELVQRASSVRTLFQGQRRR
jgi:hypothetical protein